jgi:hypothetical protein
MSSKKYNPPDNKYITLDIEFAAEYGVNEALVFAKLHRLQAEWTGFTGGDGIKWVRLTYEEWERELPFLSRNTIIRTLKSLVESGLIFETVFSGRSKWYRFNPSYVNGTTQNGQTASDATTQNEQTGLPKMGSPSTQNEQLPKSFPNSEPNKTTTTTRAREKPPDIPEKTTESPKERDPVLDEIGDLCRRHHADPEANEKFKADLVATCQRYGAGEVLDALQWAHAPDRQNGKPKNWAYVKATLKGRQEDKQNGGKNGNHSRSEKANRDSKQKTSRYAPASSWAQRGSARRKREATAA